MVRAAAMAATVAIVAAVARVVATATVAKAAILLDRVRMQRSQHVRAA